MIKYISNKQFFCSSSISAAAFNHMAEIIYFLKYFILENPLIIKSF